MGKEREPKSPKDAGEQKNPQPERLVTPQERKGEDLKRMEHPPQAEGPRETVEEDLKEKE